MDINFENFPLCVSFLAKASLASDGTLGSPQAVERSVSNGKLRGADAHHMLDQVSFGRKWPRHAVAEYANCPEGLSAFIFL